MLASFFTTYFVHVLNGRGYAWWSGAGSDIGEVTIIGGLVMVYRKHECHLDGCHWPSFHPHDEHGHPVCRRHYKQSGDGHRVSGKKQVPLMKPPDSDWTPEDIAAVMREHGR
jgi:hypothetical protein